MLAPSVLEAAAEILDTRPRAMLLNAPARRGSTITPPASNGSTPPADAVPTTLDEILEEMDALGATAAERTLTDEEAERYERLEAALVRARRSQNIANRQRGYTTPVVPADLASLVHAAPARVDDTYNQAFTAYLRTGQPNADLINAQGVGTDPGGGFLVSPQFRQKLVDVMKAYGGLAAEVDSFPTERGGDIEYPSVDDTASVGAITAEGAAFTTGTDLVFGTVILKAWKYTSTGADASAGLRVSVELLQDAEFDIEALLARKLGERIQRKQAVDWVTGAGTSLPFGIMHAGLTADVVLAAGNAVTYQKLLDVETALDPAYEQNARWVMNKASWMKCRAVVDTTGRPLLFDANAGIQDQPRQRTLLGYPVVIDQAAPSIGTLSARCAVLGDLREAYAIRRVSQFAMVVNPFTRANFGQVEYVAWERADGNVQNRKAYALLQNNAA